MQNPLLFLCSFFQCTILLHVTQISRTATSKCSFTKPRSTHYQIHINSRDMTPICFGKNTASSRVLIQRLKPAKNVEIIFAMCHNLYYDLKLISIVYIKCTCVVIVAPCIMGSIYFSFTNKYTFY